MNGKHPVLSDHLASSSDTTRSRMLLVLDRRQLTVGEICAVMQLPQSTVSRHLKALADGGWAGPPMPRVTSNLYTMTRDELDAPARRLWQLVREQVSATPAAANDQRRLQSTLAARRSKSQEFFSSSAGQWDRVRDELFGDRFHLAALGALASAEWIVGTRVRHRAGHGGDRAVCLARRRVDSPPPCPAGASPAPDMDNVESPRRARGTPDRRGAHRHAHARPASRLSRTRRWRRSRGC
jgi:DNA-binding MarR family transcriptional regulator